MNARGVLGRGGAKGKKESAGGGLICCCKGKGRCDECGRKRKRQTSDTAWYALRVFGVSIGITCPVTRSSCGKQKDTSSATNTRQPTFLHFSSSTLHVHPLFRTKQNRLMLHQPHFLLTHTMKRVFVTTPRQLPICYASPPCPLPARLLWGSLLQRERTRDGMEYSMESMTLFTSIV